MMRPVCLVETVNSPGVLHIIIGQTDASVFGIEARFRIAADGGDHEDAIAPNDRTRV